MKKINLIIVLVGFSFILTYCKNDDSINDPSSDMPIVLAKINGADFTPTTSISSSNEKEGITLEFSNNNTIIRIETNGSKTGVYNVKSIGSAIATVYCSIEGIEREVTSGSIELLTNSNNIITGKYSFTASGALKKTNSVIEVTGQFENVPISNLIDLISGVYKGKSLAYKDTTETKNDSIFTSYEVSSEAFLSNDGNNNANINVIANNNEITPLNYLNLKIRPNSWIQQDTSKFLYIKHEVYELGKMEISTVMIDSLHSVDSLCWRTTATIDNKKLSIKDHTEIFSGVKE
jgi:hypothetical protein